MRTTLLLLLRLLILSLLFNQPTFPMWKQFCILLVNCKS